MNRSKEWYAKLRKPAFAPPAGVFGPVWTFLYIVIAFSFGYVALQTFRGTLPITIFELFVLNLILNLLYTPLQFGLRNFLLATIDILLVLATLIAALTTIYSYAPWVTFVNIPYLLWVAFATILQCAITAMNRTSWTV